MVGFDIANGRGVQLSLVPNSVLVLPIDREGEEALRLLLWTNRNPAATVSVLIQVVSRRTD